MVVAGIDVGKHGGIAVVEDGKLLLSASMPLKDNDIDVLKLAEYLSHPSASVYVEKVHSMPGQGVKSTFNFGRSLGIIEAVAKLKAARVELVVPQVWKKLYPSFKGLDREQGKTEAVRLAEQIAGVSFSRPKRGGGVVGLDGNADAYLIALYAAKKEGMQTLPKM